MSVKLIVAHDDRRGIGLDGTMPWHIPGELAWTSRTTRACPPGSINALVMGRATFGSIPTHRRPLFDRANIVISAHRTCFGENVHSAADFTTALQCARQLEHIHDIYIFGGATVYRQALDTLAADELLISTVPGDHHCDAFFPPIPAQYRLASSAEARYDGVAVRHDRYVK